LDGRPQDWRGFSSATIAQRVLNQTRAGGIVVLHPASPGTPGAVPAIINGLRARGYRFATLS
jgi:peptidoglycan-N-acetylglucosamine deacetylase